jgi:hypothetical protein
VADAGAGSAPVGESLAGSDDKAVAIGTAAGGAQAYSGDGNYDIASANGAGSQAYSVVGNDDHSTVIGTGSTAISEGSVNFNNPPTNLALGNHDTTFVKGNDSEAEAGTSNANPGSNDTAIVRGNDSDATAGFGFVHERAEVIGDTGTATATDHNGQIVIVHAPEMTPLTPAHVMPSMPLP